MQEQAGQAGVDLSVVEVQPVPVIMSYLHAGVALSLSHYVSLNFVSRIVAIDC